VQSLAGVGVVAVRFDNQDVLLGEPGELDSGGLVVSGDIDISTASPLSVALCTVAAAKSMAVAAPAIAANSTVVVDRNVFVPGLPSPSVRSRTMR
jgi:hypothetical protein